MSFGFRLARPTEPLGGQGIHRGGDASVRLLPTREAGLFWRPLGRPDISAPVGLEAARGAPRRSVLAYGEERFETVEHLLSALYGSSVGAALIEIDGDEAPILEGSAAPWIEVIAPALEAAPLSAPWRVARAFELRHEAASFALSPSRAGVVVCSISFPHPLIGDQRFEWSIGDTHAYAREIAPARTFGFMRDARQLWEVGLAKGANTSNVVVFDDAGLVEGELRFADEPVRHKLLDAIGDLALLGGPLQGVLRLERPSHALVVEGLRAAVAAGVLVRG